MQVFNQIFEHYARTHDYKQSKATLRLMSQVGKNYHCVYVK